MNIKFLFCYNKGVFMISPNCPVVIPTYKNRPDNLVQHLDEISDNEIYVFC